MSLDEELTSRERRWNHDGWQFFELVSVLLCLSLFEIFCLLFFGMESKTFHPTLPSQQFVGPMPAKTLAAISEEGDVRIEWFEKW